MKQRVFFVTAFIWHPLMLERIFLEIVCVNLDCSQVILHSSHIRLSWTQNTEFLSHSFSTIAFEINAHVTQAKPSLILIISLCNNHSLFQMQRLFTVLCSSGFFPGRWHYICMNSAVTSPVLWPSACTCLHTASCNQSHDSLRPPAPHPLLHRSEKHGEVRLHWQRVYRARQALTDSNLTGRRRVFRGMSEQAGGGGSWAKNPHWF